MKTRIAPSPFRKRQLPLDQAAVSKAIQEMDREWDSLAATLQAHESLCQARRDLAQATGDEMPADETAVRDAGRRRLRQLARIRQRLLRQLCLQSPDHGLCNVKPHEMVQAMRNRRGS